MTDEVREYLAAVRAQLADLPAEDRDELLADVEISVHEAAAEGVRQERLGTPETFAAELRAAAGLAPRPAPVVDTPQGPGLREQLGALIGRARDDERVQRARELAPVWWVARAWVAVVLLTMMTGGAFSAAQPAFPAPLGGPGSALLILCAVAGSVWLGMKRKSGRLLIAFNVLLALGALVAVARVANAERATQVVYVESGTGTDVGALGLNRSGEPVRNIYAFSRDGTMLLDVLLYDDLGRPLDIGAPQVDDALRRQVDARDGRRLFNVFPIRYLEPGTGKVANPKLAPEIDVPAISTPPLVRERRP